MQTEKVNSQSQGTGNNASEGKQMNTFRRSQISAIESLAYLLLREVEALKQSDEDVYRNLIEGNPINLSHELLKFESSMIRAALIQAGGVQYKAAQLLGLKPSTLNEKIKRQGIDFSLPADEVG